MKWGIGTKHSKIIWMRIGRATICALSRRPGIPGIASAEKIQNLVAHPEIRLQMGAINHKIAAYLQNARKGYLLLRVYSGERITETIPFAELVAQRKD